MPGIHDENAPMSDYREPEATALVRRLDWNLLRTFVVVVEARGITRAADRLGLQQPTVSNALRRLEETLGRKLIDRSPGTFELTEAGRLLHEEAVAIHGSILRLGITMRDVTEQVSGHVRIAMASHVVCPLFDQVLADFRGAYPMASLSLDVTGSGLAIDDVLAQRASLAICLVKSPDPRLKYTMLYREFFGLYCGPTHPLFGRGREAPLDLRGHDWVSFTTDQMNDVLQPVTVLRALAAPEDRIVGTSTHLEEVRRMILAGLGIGPLPVHVARRDERDGLLWRLRTRREDPAIDVFVAENPLARKNRAEAALRRMLIEKIAATPLAERIYA
jgi:DNA-binding transcriptional LysR family regulator